MAPRNAIRLSLLALACALAACSGGSQPSDEGTGTGGASCNGHCLDTPTRLSTADVGQVIAQAVQEAAARNAPATIAVTDRVGNVLAVYRMNGATGSVRVGSPAPLAPVDGGLEGISLIPSELSAIAKALTGAYLSSEGNAFTTRTASQIVQANFNPGERDQPGGPLFGVQFSQLPCSDLAARFQAGAGAGPGPHRSPLGLSADPGGLPLYKNGTVVGGVGVESDGAYTLDPSILDRDADVDELIAVAGSFGFAAPIDRRADRITADGKTLRFADVDFDDLAATPSAAPAFATLADGALLAVSGYTEAAPALVTGTAFGETASGHAPATDAAFAARDAVMLVDALGNNRYPPSASAGLSAAEVRQLLLSALDIANRARAQIRRPLGSPMRATISVVGVDGAIVGVVRTRDAPVFGTDVSLQKARAALLFSQPAAATLIASLPPAGYLVPDSATPAELRREELGDYITDARAELGNPTAFDDGAVAYAARSIGNLSRPFFPDGIAGTRHGVFSKPAGEWSPFSTGLQLDLGYNAIVRHVAFVAGLVTTDVDPVCAGVAPLADGLTPTPGLPPVVNNGIQIFPGGVPIYRGTTLVGAIGVSGDGIEQDDMVAFLGTHDAAQALGGAINNAPSAMRADQLEIDGVHPRYIQCPQAPFLDSNQQDACAGK